MNNALKILLGFIGLLVVAFLGVWIYLKIEFSDEALTQKVNDALGAQLHRPAKLEKVSLAIWPPISLEITNFTIANPSDSAFSQARPMIEIPKLQLRLDVFALLNSQIAIREILMISPYILQETALNGKTNLEGLMKADTLGKSESTQAPEPQAEESLFSPDLLIDRFVVEDLTYEKLDRKGNSTLTLSESSIQLQASLEPKASLLTTDGQFSLGKLSFSNAFGSLVENLRVEGFQKSRFWLNTGKLVFDEASAKAGELTLTMEGGMDSLLTDQMQLDLHLHAPTSDLKSALSLLSKDLTKDISDAKTSGSFSFDLDLVGTLSDSLLPDYNLTFNLEDGRIQYPSLPKPITNLQLNGTVKNTSFELSQFMATLGSNGVEGTLKVQNFENPYLNIRLNTKLNLSEILEFYPLEKGTSLSGFLSSNLKASGLINNPQKIKATGTAQFSKVGFNSPGMQTPLKNLQGSLELSNNRLEIRDLSMQLGQSDLQLNGYTTNYLNLVLDQPQNKNTPYIYSSLSSKTLNLDELLPPDTAQTKREQPNATPQKREQLPDINAKLNVAIQSLTINGINAKQAKGTVLLQNKILDLSGLSLMMFGGKASMNGKITLKDINKPKFDLNVSLKSLQVSNMFKEIPSLDKFAGLGNYLSAELSLNSSMKGKLNDTLGLDLPSFLANGDFKMPFGKLSGMPVQKNIAKALKNDKLKSVSFKNWKHRFNIKNGRVYVNDLSLNVDDTEVRADGSQGIDNSLDYKVQLKLPKSATKGLQKSIGSLGTKLVTDKSGKVPVDLLVKGTLTDPKITLNKDALISNAAKNVIEPLKQEVKTKAEKKADKLKKDIQKKVDENKKKLEKETKKSLKKLFNF